MAAESKNLTAKQLRFIEEYLVDSNGTQACIRAGYSKKGANVQAAQLLAKLSIQEAIRIRQKELGHHLRISQERIRQELARVAFGTMADVATWGHGAEDRSHFQLKGSDELDADALALISEIKIKRRFVPGSDPEGPPDEIEETGVKLHDKLKAIEMICKLQGYYRPDQLDVKLKADPSEVRGRLLERLTRLAPKEAKGEGDGGSSDQGQAPPGGLKES